MKKMNSMLLAASMAVFGTAALADGDSNADVGQAFAAQLEQSEGVIVRVPVNAQGQEDSTSAEMRVLTSGQNVASPEAAATAFDQGLDASTGSVLNFDSDSSTSHSSRDSYGWNSWNSGNNGYSGNNYSNSYYYNSYQPTYHCGSSYSYNYSRPVYYNYTPRVYSSYGYWEYHPYNYYHYSRRW